MLIVGTSVFPRCLNTMAVKRAAAALNHHNLMYQRPEVEKENISLNSNRLLLKRSWPEVGHMSIPKSLMGKKNATHLV